MQANLSKITADRIAGQVTAGRVGAVWAAGHVSAGRGGLRAKMWQHLQCGLTAGQVTAGRAAGQEMINMRGGLRAQISSPRRALICI